tara:strand:- start:28 stop:552 length:525 start_codon:yes stop_codon:yes gene_type:complete
MAWDWLQDNLGGTVDWFTGGRTDLDGKGSSGGSLWGKQVDPWSPTDWLNNFTKVMGSGGPTAAGQSFARSYTPPSSTATAVTGPSGSTGTLGDDVAIFNPPPFVALKDNPEPPSSSGSSGGNKTLQTLGTIASIAAPFICDIRVKTDISPLETTDITDDLAEVAFFVKGLRECS